MHLLQIIHGYKAIYKQKAESFETIDQKAREIGDSMVKTMHHEGAIGLGANMVGILKRVIVVDMADSGQKDPIIAFNPEIINKSDELQTIEEASIAFPGISVPISRPKEIEVSYLDYEGKKTSLKLEGFFASVFQHEIDYLDGITIFDHVSKMKKELLLKKLEKNLKFNPPHIHGTHCHH
ncbi:MAG: peptide deformylase [Rickettsiaceae bacterium]|nr:peptide deformylase [Rickettsiaceae bacterium]